MRGRIVDHRAQGYRGHSIKIGAFDDKEGSVLDAERITACLADRRPGEFFIVDTNGGLLPEMALHMLQLLPHGVDFALETPYATWRETMSFRRRCPYPIVIDELVQLHEDIAFTVVEDIADETGLKIFKASGRLQATAIGTSAVPPDSPSACKTPSARLLLSPRSFIWTPPSPRDCFGAS